MREQILRDKEMRRRKAAEDIKKEEVNALIIWNFMTEYSMKSFTGKENRRYRTIAKTKTHHSHRKENNIFEKESRGK